MSTQPVDMTPFQQDEASRKLIISETGRNIFVEAGAGSGKTTMLVNRMVAMVEAGVDIREINAITFTKAAAREFYGRFQKILIERSDPNRPWNPKGFAGELPEPTPESRSRCASALRNFDLCFLGTIDSFCQMVLGEHPSEAQVPADAKAEPDEDMGEFYRQWFAGIANGEHGQELQDYAKVFSSFQGKNAEDAFVAGMTIWMKNRNASFIFDRIELAEAERLFAKALEPFAAAVQLLSQNRTLGYLNRASDDAAWAKIDDACKALNRGRSRKVSDVMYYLEKVLPKIRLIPEAIEQYGPTLSPYFEPGGSYGRWLDCTIGRPGGLIGKLENIRYRISMTFLEKCVPAMEQDLRTAGGLTFFDSQLYLRDMLKRDAAENGVLIRYISKKHRFFLVDEFQDTNPLQAEIIFYLCAEEPVPEWYECRPRPGSLFIVGDPKQSIYRFTGADIASYLRVKGLFEKNGDLIAPLTRNFRSAQPLCEYYNRIFPRLLPAQTATQSKFEKIPVTPAPELSAAPFEGVFSFTADKTTFAEKIAETIFRLVDSNDYLIRRDPQQAKLDRISYRDFMIITPSKTSLPTLEEALASRGIPVRVEGNVPFDKCSALREIERIYSAIANPEDPRALYVALIGILIGLPESDVEQFRAAGGRLSLTAANDSAALRTGIPAGVAAALDKLKSLHAASRTLSPAALFSAIADEYRIYESLPAEKVEVACYALELIRRAESNGEIASIKDGAARLSAIAAKESGEERCLRLDKDENCVHLANLHKVKGLEAPIVILSRYWEFNKDASLRIERDFTGSSGYVFSLDNGDCNSPIVFFKTASQDAKKAEEAVNCAEEEDHKRYVAATRARNALIICDIGDRSGWRSITETGTTDFFTAIAPKPPANPAEPVSVNAASLYGQAGAECAINAAARVATFSQKKPSDQPSVASKLSDSLEDEAFEEDSATDEQPAAAPSSSPLHAHAAWLGTSVHRLLEMLVLTKGGINVEAAIRQVIRENHSDETAALEPKLDSALKQVAETMLAGGFPQRNAAPQNLFGTVFAADEVYCELPFSYLDDTATLPVIWNGVMDLVYRVGNEWHIVDYKTNAGSEDWDAHYANQLDAYKKAFKATTGIDVTDALTYHITI